MALPGVTTILRDQFSTLSRTDIPVGPRVVAIAPRTTANMTNGVADLDPYLATDAAEVVTTFGWGSGCHRAYLELMSGGATRVYLVALPSTTTDANLTVATAGNVFDAAFDAAETVLPDMIFPWGRGSHPTDWDDQATPATPGNNLQFGFFADNATAAGTSLVKRVADKCADITNRSHPVFAVMGVKPALGGGPTDSLTPAQVTTHLTVPNLMSRNDPLNANGMYVSVVTTEANPTNYPGLPYGVTYPGTSNGVFNSGVGEFGYSNGAGLYSGSISQLNSWSAPTNKVLFNVRGLRYNPTRTQQQNLIDKGIVPVTLNFNRVPIWVDSMTFAKPNSDYFRLTTLRIVFDAINMVRQIAQTFVGESATLEHRNALETAITSGLRGMQQAGALLASDFVVSYIPTQNKATVDLVLTPVFEMRNIEVTVSVQL